MKQPFPGVPKPLLDRLKEIFPDQLPTNFVNPFETGRLIGQQDVLRKLKHEFDQQNKPTQTTLK